MKFEIDGGRLLWTGAIGLLCFVLGFFVSGRLLANADPNRLAIDIDGAARGAAAEQQLVIVKAQFAQLQQRSQACEQKFLTETVLYEPGQPLTVPVFRGALNLQAGPAMNLPVSTVPHWVIPAMITPRSLGPSNGMYYTQIDGRTQLITGPFEVAQSQPGDRYNINGWSNQ